MRKIRLKMTTQSTDNPVSVIKGAADFRQKDGKTLITHLDEQGTKTAIIIDGKRVVLSRKSPLYSYRLPIEEGRTTKGLMGEENIFCVIGKRVCLQEGRVFLEYTLPDLGENPADFRVEIEYA